MKLFGFDIPLPDLGALKLPALGTPAGMAVAGAGGAAALAGAAMLAMGAFGDDDLAPVDLAGKWEVAYHDRILGRVRGKATVADGEGSAEVVLTHPKTKEEYTLRSTRFARSGDTLNVTLEGQWPGAEGYVEPPLGEAKPVGAGSPYEWQGPEKITLAHGDSEETFKVLKDQPVGKHKVEMELYIGDEALTGSWKQWANAVTGRDESEGGRIADFRFAGDGTGRAYQTGIETWYRPRPIIHAVAPSENQLAIREYLGAKFPYPWKADGSSAGILIDRRYLLVVGDELPTETGETVELKSLNADVEYFVEAKRSQYGDRPTAQLILDNAFAHIRQNLKQQMLADGIGNEALVQAMMDAIYEKDWILIRAELKRPAAPGRKGFTLNGAEGSWVLRYGDFVADFAVTRPVGAETEGADHVLIPEKIYLEFRTAAPLLTDELPVQLWVNDEVHVFAGNRTIMAKRLPRTKEDDEALAELREAVRFAGGNVENVKPIHIYRTPPIGLVDKGQEASGGAMDLPEVGDDWRVTVKDGDTIRGVSAATDILRTEPFHAQAKVVNSPAEIVRHTAPGLGAAQNLTWTRAVMEAARCTGTPIDTPVDFDALARRKAATFKSKVYLADAAKRATGKEMLGAIGGEGWLASGARLGRDAAAGVIQSPTAFTGGETYALDMLVGDHAAMLILREAFIEMMTRQIEDVGAIRSDAAIYGFRASAEIPSSYAPNHPFSTIDVKAPNGKTVSFSFSYASDDLLKQELGLDAAAAEAWRLDATRQMLREYLASLRAALGVARAIKTCGEHQKLVELTGRGFAAVNRYARSRLMTAQSIRGERDDAWKADRVARAWMAGVPVFAEALSAQQSLSAQDTKIIVIAATIGTSAAAAGGGLLGWAVGYEALFFSTVATMADVANAAHVLYTEVGHKLNTTAEVRFARGAHAVLGDARLEQALAEDRHWAEISAGLYLDVVPSLAFTSGVDFLKGLKDIGGSSAAVYRGGKRLVSQARSIERGRKLLGEVSVGTGVGQAAPPRLAQLEPPKIPAEDFAKNFPDGKDVQRASNLELDDLIDPANPGKLPDVEDLTKTQATPPAQPRAPPEPSGTAASDTILEGAPGSSAAGDTIIEGTPGAPATPAPGSTSADDTIRVGQPGDGAAPSSGADTQRLPEADAARANADQLDRMRNDANAGYEKARENAQQAFAEGRDITPGEGNELLKGAHTAAAQEVIETAISEARRVGLTESEIHAIISKYDVASGRGDLMRFAMLDELQRTAIPRAGLEIADGLYAEDVLQLVTRSYTGAATPAELALLKRWIDRAADAGEDFFSRLQRQGTYTDLDGFEHLADADGIASLRKLAADNDLLPMSLLETQALTASERLAESSIGKVRGLPEPQRIDVANAIFDARRLAAEAGLKALDATEQAALRIAESVVGDAGGVPAWARGLDRASYEKIAHLGGRADFQKLIEADPSILRQAAGDPDVRAVIELQPYRDPAEFQKALANERKRVKQPLPGAFDEAAEDHWLPKQVMKDGKEQPVAFKHEVLEGDGKKFSTDKFLNGGDDVAVVERELGLAELPEFAGSKQMTWSYMEAKLLPDFFDNVNVPMISDRGTSSAAMLNMRAFHNLDIPFGDPSLKLIKMSNVENANTSVQIAWMKRVYGADWTKYLPNTHSVRYAESALNQAGFRIKEVRLGSEPPLRMNARGMVEGNFFKAKETPMEFLARYGVSPNEAIETGHDIYIVVEPFGAAAPRSASAAPLRRRRRALSGWRPVRRTLPVRAAQARR